MKKRKLTFFLTIMFFCFVSCTKKSELPELYNEVIIETETIGSNDVENIPDFTYSNDNYQEIRDSPDIDSEILGLINLSEYFSVIDISEQKDLINDSNYYWYKITNENITGWISGECLEPIISEQPNEFVGKSWRNYFGSLYPVENITLDDLQSCSWQRESTFLHFSQDGNYARMDSWDSNKYGRYKLIDNTIYFFPPIKVIRFAREYVIDKLHYSNELHFEGTPVLRDDDETVIFSANDSQSANIGDIVRTYQYYCEKMWERAKINTSGILYALPDTSSINMFEGEDNYYGRKATEVTAVKLAKTTINDVVWYYTLVDFTGDEPTDRGGPFYDGWLSEEYFE